MLSSHSLWRTSCGCGVGFTVTTIRSLSVTVTEEPQALSSASCESRLVVGPRFNELLVEAGHPPVVVAVLLTDLQESPSGYLAAQAIDLI
jgi:hypothetical protein